MLSNSSFIQNKSFFTLALLTLATLSSTSCSLKAVGDGDSSGVASIVIRIPGLYSKQHTLTPYEKFLNLIGLGTTNAALPPPQNLNDFRCYMVNVMGGGIPKNPNDNKGGGQPMQIDPSWSAEKKRSCSTYPGFVSKLVPANQGGELSVDGFTADHVGKNVIVQVIGIQDSNVGCPNMNVFEAERSLGAKLEGMYELGRANAQINAGVNNISVNNSFNAANASDRTISGDLCGGGGGGGCAGGMISFMYDNNTGTWGWGQGNMSTSSVIAGSTCANLSPYGNSSGTGCPACESGQNCIQPPTTGMNCVKMKFRPLSPAGSPGNYPALGSVLFAANQSQFLVTNLVGNNVTFYSDYNCSIGATSGISIPQVYGKLAGVEVDDSPYFYFKPTAAGWGIQAGSPGMCAASLGAPSGSPVTQTLKLVGPHNNGGNYASIWQTNLCSGPYQISLTNLNDVPVSAASAIAVTLSGAGFYSDSICTSAISNTSIPVSTSSSANFYIKAPASPMTFAITATSPMTNVANYIGPLAAVSSIYYVQSGPIDFSGMLTIGDTNCGVIPIKFKDSLTGSASVLGSSISGTMSLYASPVNTLGVAFNNTCIGAGTSSVAMGAATVGVTGYSIYVKRIGAGPGNFGVSSPSFPNWSSFSW